MEEYAAADAARNLAAVVLLLVCRRSVRSFCVEFMLLFRAAVPSRRSLP